MGLVVILLGLSLSVTLASGYVYGATAMRQGNNGWFMNQNRNRNVNNYGQQVGNSLQSGRCEPNNCQCSLQFIPFCATNGQTYANRCQLQCAQNCDSGIRVKFEGVCPEPYDPSSENRQGFGFSNSPPKSSQAGRPLISQANAYNNNNEYNNGNVIEKLNRASQYTPTRTPYAADPESTTSISRVFTTMAPTTSTKKLGRYGQWLATSTSSIRPWYEPAEPKRGREFENIQLVPTTIRPWYETERPDQLYEE